MKNLIIVNGTMGAGKTSVCRELQELLPKNVFLDGDWCWSMKPFVVNEETKSLVMSNITFTLNGFLHCGEFENIIFCWVLHERSIIDELLSRLDLADCRVRIFTLTLNEEALKARLQADVERGLREPDVIPRSSARLPLYTKQDTEKLDVSEIDAREAARLIYERL